MYASKLYSVRKNFVRLAMSKKIEYPTIRKDTNVAENLHGKVISDPYRWLEDPTAEETKDYIRMQNELSQPFLESGENYCKIRSKLEKLWNYPKYGCPEEHGRHFYYWYNSGLQNQSVLHQQEYLKGTPNVFLDPNALSEDGTVSLSVYAFSEDGSYLAYGLSENGSDWVSIRIRSVETTLDMDEMLKEVKFSSISWTYDNKGFFYSRYPTFNGKTAGVETRKNENQQLFYHYLGEPQEKDIMVFGFQDQPQWQTSSTVSHCGEYLFLTISKDCHGNKLYYAKIDSNKNYIKSRIEKIVDNFDHEYKYITNSGDTLYLQTNKDAPNYRIVAIDLKNKSEDNWITLIPEHVTDVLDWTKCVDNNKLLLCYIHDVKSRLQVNCLDTGSVLREFKLDIGTIVGVSGKKQSSVIFYKFSSFLNPGRIFYYDFKNPDSDPEVYQDIQLNCGSLLETDYKIEQVFFPSKDGTSIPMFIVRKNHETVVPRPCLLYGYGGFNISIQPTFGLTGFMFLDTYDGVLAYPSLRGGGEYGEKWYDGGRLLNKQNVFDDFQSAAHYLIEKNYTQKNKIVIQGGSNGGLLIGACINQQPNLFGAAICEVGVFDMLRFHKFTIGYAWCSDYGNPDEKIHFENVMKYSPLHNVRTPQQPEEEYPPTLILTADHDDRVSPFHSLKFAATLQEAARKSNFQTNPLLLRVYVNAGHGAGKPTSKRIQEISDILSFISKTLDIDVINI